jgi:RNA polymerase sigma-70 factor (ECF subfamily)
MDGTRIARELLLAERVRAGDGDALAELYTRYRPALLAFAAGYLVDPTEAADVVQDVFVDVWRNRRTWVIDQSVAGYLYVATRNGAMQVVKHRQRWRASLLRDTHATVFNSGETRLTGPELERAIDRVVNRLPERCRLIYRMHRDAHCSYDEIATALGISPQTVRLQLIKAWDILGERLAAAGWVNVLRRQ